jgi:hypothetical protein
MQLLDDFLDKEKDLTHWIYTYATQCSKDELYQISALLNDWRKKIEVSLIELWTPASKILLHWMRAYSILNKFWPKDNIKENPYNIPLE